MNRWSVRMAACLTLASALDAVAGEPLANPSYFAPQERLQLPFGYHQTQWRSFPGFGDDLPPITIVIPPIVAPLPAPIEIAPDLKLPEPPKPLRVPEKPEKKETPQKKDGSKVILPSSSSVRSTSRLVLPPDEPPGMNPTIRPLVPRNGLPIQVPDLLPHATTPVIPDLLLFEKMKEPAENPAVSQKPKAWLELPMPPPTIRGSSHLLEKEEAPLPPIWRATR